GVAAIYHTDIVQAQKSALEDIIAFCVLPVDPPSKIQHQPVKTAFQEFLVALTAVHFLIDLIYPLHGISMDRRVHIAKVPFIRRYLPIRVHVPVVQEKRELGLCKIGIKPYQRNTMESQVPSRIPRVLPLIGHGDDVIILQVPPMAVSALLSLLRRRIASGVSL